MKFMLSTISYCLITCFRFNYWDDILRNLNNFQTCHVARIAQLPCPALPLTDVASDRTGGCWRPPPNSCRCIAYRLLSCCPRHSGEVRSLGVPVLAIVPCWILAPRRSRSLLVPGVSSVLASELTRLAMLPARPMLLVLG